MLCLTSALLSSIGLGFVLNRLVLRRIPSGSVLSKPSLAASRAIFYAPAFIHIGHGAYLPAPLTIAVADSFREFGPELGVFTFLLPLTVFIGSLVVPRLIYGRNPSA